MEPRQDISEFLTSRRARITPEEAGVQSFGIRRVKGLRREEVALLAGVSTDYYAKVERGTVSTVSPQVFEGIAAALRLDETEIAHLRDLMRTASPIVRSPRRKADRMGVPASVQRLLESMVDVPAVVQNRRFDLVATNELGRALFTQVFDSPGNGNHARYLFLDNRSRDFLPAWEAAANDVVAVLRASTAKDPFDSQLTNLIGELSARSEDFRVRWASRNVYAHTSGTKTFRHPTVGDLTLDFDAMALPGDSALKLMAYSCAAGSASMDAVRVLGSWSSTSTALKAAAASD